MTLDFYFSSDTAQTDLCDSQVGRDMSQLDPPDQVRLDG